VRVGCVLGFKGPGFSCIKFLVYIKHSQESPLHSEAKITSGYHPNVSCVSLLSVSALITCPTHPLGYPSILSLLACGRRVTSGRSTQENWPFQISDKIQSLCFDWHGACVTLQIRSNQKNARQKKANQDGGY